MISIKDSLRKGFNAQGFNHAWNENEIGGQSVPHFHLHVIPRTDKDEVRYNYEPREFLYRATANRKVAPQEELKEVAILIKQNLG